MTRGSARALLLSALLAVSACSTARGLKADMTGALTAMGLAGPTTNAGGFNVHDGMNASNGLNAGQ